MRHICLTGLTDKRFVKLIFTFSVKNNWIVHDRERLCTIHFIIIQEEGVIQS